MYVTCPSSQKLTVLLMDGLGEPLLTVFGGSSGALFPLSSSTMISGPTSTPGPTRLYMAFSSATTPGGGGVTVGGGLNGTAGGRGFCFSGERDFAGEAEEEEEEGRGEGVGEGERALLSGVDGRGRWEMSGDLALRERDPTETFGSDLCPPTLPGGNGFPSGVDTDRATIEGGDTLGMGGEGPLLGGEEVGGGPFSPFFPPPPPPPRARGFGMGTPPAPSPGSGFSSSSSSFLSMGLGGLPAEVTLLALALLLLPRLFGKGRLATVGRPPGSEGFSLTPEVASTLLLSSEASAPLGVVFRWWEGRGGWVETFW